MSSVLAPDGLRPAAKVGNAVYNGGITQYPLTTDNAAALAVGDLVALVGGTIASVAAAAAAGTLSANTPIGIFVGAEYMDPARGFVCSEILKAAAVTAGYTSIKVLVVDDPKIRMTVQANGTVAASALGSTISLTNFGASDLVVRTSRVKADVATISNSGASTGPLKIVGFVADPTNAAGDAFTRIVVQWNANTHYLEVQGAH